MNICNQLYRFFVCTYCCVTICACSKEQAVPVVADFQVSIVEEDYSVPVQVLLTNRTTGADSYEWIFSGAIPALSEQRNPGVIRYDKAGVYTILLRAMNRDGIEDEQQLTIDLDAPLQIDFSARVAENNFSPVTVLLENKTTGANSYTWSFDNGTPSFSSSQHPENILFTTPGTHTIQLEVTNGRETRTQDTTIVVAPDIVADFDWEVAFQDKDLQVPVTLSLQNKSISATAYTWSFENGIPETTTISDPEVTFSTAGVHEIVLTATNGKQTKTHKQTITLLEDTNIKVLEDIRFGINTAHNANTIGSFFSTYAEKSYSKSEVTDSNGSLIDLVFFGLNQDFSFNRFYAPDMLDDTTFEAIPNAMHTRFINSLENCNTSLSVAQFDTMEDDRLLKTLTITETIAGLQPFDTAIPKIVLFSTADGRKGAIKIKRFVVDGKNSYIETDIKVQKRAN